MKVSDKHPKIHLKKLNNEQTLSDRELSKVIVRIVNKRLRLYSLFNVIQLAIIVYLLASR